MAASRQPPLRARLYRYTLTTAELALLQAMCEHCSSGETIYASTPRLAAYCKLSERQAQRIIHQLVKRHILRQLAPANGRKRRPATYSINEAALREDPAVMSYLARQNQYAFPPNDLVTPCHPPPVTPRRLPGDTMSPDPKAFDPTAKTKVIQHGDAALNSLPAWLALKEQLRSELSPEEWDLWVRPMYLLKALSGSTHLLAALPHSAKIQAAAVARLPLVRELLAPVGYSLSLTKYPDDWEIQEAKKLYGVDIAPKSWTREGSA